jgi:hypothetical protein
MKLFRLSNSTNSIQAVADWLGARAVMPRWRRCLVVALLAGSAGASRAQFYQPNYITNNAGFDAVLLPAGTSVNYGPGPKLTNGWTYSGDAGIARDSTNKTSMLMTDDLNGYPGRNYAYLQESITPGSLTRTVNLPLLGNYQLQFYSPGAYTNGHIIYSTTVTDPQGNDLLTTQTLAGNDQTHVLSFWVTIPGPCLLSFGNLTNSTGPTNAVLLDNISIVKADFGLLANGDFDATPLSPGQYQYYAAQSQPVDSWAYAGNAGIATDSANKANFATGYPGVYAGANYAFLQTATGTAGSMEQSVMLPAQGAYWLMSFSYAGRQAGPAFGGNASFRASVIDSNGGTLVSTQLVTSSGQLFNNQILAFTAANKGPFTLRFDNVQNTSGTDNTVFIDDVQLLAPGYQFSAAAPIITEEPVSVTNLVGTPETLHGSAILLSGGMPAYQWFEGSSQFPSNAVPVTGATSPDLTLPATTNDYTRTFFLRAYNGSGYHSDSLTATVRIVLPPAITSQPADQVVLPGQPATLSVGVSGTPPLTYQWYSGLLGDTSNPVGTTSSYTTPPVSADATFWVEVLNDAGPNYAVTSRLASVTFLTQQPSGLTVCAGDPATFAVGFGAPSDAPANIQWQRSALGGSFTNIPGATSSSYTIPAVSAADDGSLFRAVFINSGTNLVTAEAPLSVVTISAPTIVYNFGFGAPTNTAIYGSAFVLGKLLLNPAMPGQNGAWLTADLAPGQAVSGFIAHFTAIISPGSPPTPLADGFSFNWAPDLPNGSYAVAEQGEGSGLRVCFLTYDDGSGYAPAIDVKWGTNVIGHFQTTYAFLSNQGTLHDVMIRLNTDGTLDMTYSCVSIFTRLPIPGYQPQFNSRFGLGSRTGAYEEAVAINGVSLQLFVDPTNGLPCFTSMTPQAPSGLAINGAGAPNAQYPLFTSQDLVNWQFRTNVTLGSNGLFQFVEPDISSSAKQFYRLRAAPNLPAGLDSWWRGDGNYLDSFGGRNGIPSSNAPSFTAGVRTPAFNFAGTNALSINSASLSSPWTLCFWVNRPLPDGSIETLFSDPSSSLNLDQDGLGHPGLTQATGSVTFADTSVPAYQWTHLAFVSGTGGLSVLVNGVVSDTVTGTFILPLSVMGAGTGGISHGVKAAIDEVMVFDRALTPAQVSQVINATRAP